METIYADMTIFFCEYIWRGVCEGIIVSMLGVPAFRTPGASDVELDGCESMNLEGNVYHYGLLTYRCLGGDVEHVSYSGFRRADTMFIQL